MEEKKQEKSVKNETKKLTYEQLEQIANNLNSQCKQLYSELMEARQILANFNDVGILLNIIDKSEYFNPQFIERCTKKVEDTIIEMMDSADAKKEEEKEN